MPDPVETVLFDVDDTLCEYRRSGGAVLEIAFEAVGVDPFFTAPDYYSRVDDVAGECDSMRELRAECFAAIAADRGRDPDLGRAVADAYAEERDHRNVRFRPGAREAVESLAGDHRLGIVTNGPPDMQRPKLASLGIREAVETVIHAGYDAPAKPAPEPFHRALDSIGGTPDAAVHVGNSLEFDVAGARNAGVRSVWVPNGDAGDTGPVPDHEIGSLHALREPPWRG